MLNRCMKMLTLLILLTSLVVAQADSNDRPDLCGALPAADCQILLDNESLMNSLNSLGFSMTLNMQVESDESMQLSGSGFGAYELDDESLQAINEMSKSAADTEVAALIDRLLTSMEMQLSVEFSISGGEEDMDIALEILLKDGILLLGGGAFEALGGESMAGMEGFGLDLTGLIGEVLGETGMLDSADMHDMEAAEAAAIAVTRLPDDELNGVAVAVFETGIDMDVLFSLLSAEDLFAASNDLEDADAAKDLMDAMEVRDLSMRQYIGLNDHYSYLFDMSLDMTIAGEKYDLASDAAFVMGMSIEFFDFNEPVDVEIPADTVAFPLAMLLQMNSQ